MLDLHDLVVIQVRELPDLTLMLRAELPHCRCDTSVLRIDNREAERTAESFRVHVVTEVGAIQSLLGVLQVPRVRAGYRSLQLASFALFGDILSRSHGQRSSCLERSF